MQGVFVVPRAPARMQVILQILKRVTLGMPSNRVSPTAAQ
jgi:hypothetical protein